MKIWRRREVCARKMLQKKPLEQSRCINTNACALPLPTQLQSLQPCGGNKAFFYGVEVDIMCSGKYFINMPRHINCPAYGVFVSMTRYLVLVDWYKMSERGEEMFELPPYKLEIPHT